MTPFERHKARIARMTSREREAWNARQRAYYHARKSGARVKLLRLSDFMLPNRRKFDEVF